VRTWEDTLKDAVVRLMHMNAERTLVTSVCSPDDEVSLFRNAAEYFGQPDRIVRVLQSYSIWEVVPTQGADLSCGAWQQVVIAIRY
jgi:hypothetical protein